MDLPPPPPPQPAQQVVVIQQKRRGCFPWFVAIAGIIVVFAVIGAVAGGDDEDDGAGGSSGSSSRRCIGVERAVLDGIAEGVEDDVVGDMVMLEGFAVRSSEFEKVFMVAARFSVPGVDDAVGVWATNGVTLADAGIMLSVDGIAKEFTVWPDADDTDAEITLSTDGVAAAKACLS